MSKYRDLLGKRLKQRMFELDLNQTEFAEKLGIKQSMVSSYVNAKIEPGLDLIVRWADALDVTPAWLLSEGAVDPDQVANKRLRLLGAVLNADAGILDAIAHLLGPSLETKNVLRANKAK